MRKALTIAGGLIAAPFVLMFAWIVITAMWDDWNYQPHPANEPAAPANEPSAVEIDKSPEMQARRREAIQEFMAAGLITKIETPGRYPRVYVLPAFQQLTFDDKEMLAGIVYAYSYDDANGTVRLVDARNEEQVGLYSALGLTLD